MRQREHMPCQGAHLIIWDKGRKMSHQRQKTRMYHHTKERKRMSQTFVLKWMSHQTHEVYYLRQRKRMSHHTRRSKKLSQSLVLKRMSHHTTVSTIWDRGKGCSSHKTEVKDVSSFKTEQCVENLSDLIDWWRSRHRLWRWVCCGPGSHWPAPPSLVTPSSPPVTAASGYRQSGIDWPACLSYMFKLQWASSGTDGPTCLGPIQWRSGTDGPACLSYTFKLQWASSVTIRNLWACSPFIHVQITMGQFSDNQELMGLLASHTCLNYNGPNQWQSGIYRPACLSYMFRLQWANSVTIRNWQVCLPRANSVTIRNVWACLPVIHVQITMGQFSDNQELMGLLAFHTHSN